MTVHPNSLKNLKPYKKGESGDLGGRPAASKELRALAQHWALEDGGIQQLIEVAQGEPGGTDWRFAVSTLIEYGFGKPGQPAEWNAPQRASAAEALGHIEHAVLAGDLDPSLATTAANIERVRLQAAEQDELRARIEALESRSTQPEAGADAGAPT
jgi:hypothetical protein